MKMSMKNSDRAWMAVGAALLVAFSAGGARADAVPPEPKNCPPGTHGVTGHAGPGCVSDHCPPGSFGTMCADGPCCWVSECGGDAGRSCGNNTCETVRLCVRPRNTVGWGASLHPVNDALATCDAGGACPGGGTCKELTACVAPVVDAESSVPRGATDAGISPSGPAVHAPGCGCRIGAAASEPRGASVVFAVAALWTLARRRSVAVHERRARDWHSRGCAPAPQRSA